MTRSKAGGSRLEKLQSRVLIATYLVCLLSRVTDGNQGALQFKCVGSEPEFSRIAANVAVVGRGGSSNSGGIYTRVLSVHLTRPWRQADTKGPRCRQTCSCSGA